MIPTKAVMGKLYAFAKLGSTAGNPKAAGSKLMFLFAKPVVGRKPAFVIAELKELSLELRKSFTRRQLPPNVSVCLPLIHVKSSEKLWTGTIMLVLRVVSTGKSKPRRRTNC